MLISQVISNVPAAILLSNYTDNFPALLIGTNLGGLGTLIASMASLISWKQIAAKECRAEKALFPHVHPVECGIPDRIVFVFLSAAGRLTGRKGCYRYESLYLLRPLSLRSGGTGGR